MDSAIQFCESILPAVSRSFALTIPMLDKKLYLPVLIAYLQDRLLDNFEDEIPEDKIDFTERKKMMDRVVELFNPDNHDPDQTASILQEYAALLNKKPLRDLTIGASSIRAAFDHLDEAIKKISYKWLLEMNKGMQKYLLKPVQTFSELDEYCYYVAGTVGGFLTETVLHKTRPGQAQQEILLDNFNNAGLFLQKVNLVRDIKNDITGREKNYWPLRSLGISAAELLDSGHKKRAMAALEEMLENIKIHIPGLVAYFEALPESLTGYRRFFCVNNALGLATMEKLEDNPAVFYGRKPVKAPRLEFMKILKSPEKAFYSKAREFQSLRN